MDLGFNLAQSNRDLKDPTSRQNFGDTSGLLCKNDLIPCLTGTVVFFVEEYVAIGCMVETLLASLLSDALGVTAV